jgi:hypothetical protein
MQLKLQQLKPDVAQEYYFRGIKAGDRFVFLGEIDKMPGHGVWVAIRDNKVHAGFHMDSFEDVTEVA